MFSPNSSSTSSLSSSSISNPLPKHRIHCETGHVIKVGCQNFQSASDALSAYLQQFDGLPKKESVKKSDILSSPLLEAYLSANRRILNKNNEIMKESKSKHMFNISKSREDVQSLLISKPCKTSQGDVLEQQTPSTQIQQSFDQQPKSGLQEEVEAALLRSAKLLEKVSHDNIQTSPTTSSDISTVPTDLLLLDSSMYKSNYSDQMENESKHIYSYHVNPPKDHTTKTHAPVSYTNSHLSRDRNRRSFYGKLISSFQQNVLDFKRTSSLSSAVSKKYNNIVPEETIRSRSASPGSTRKSISVLNMEPRNPHQKHSVPSWLREENISEISDSIWQLESDGLLNFPSLPIVHSQIGLKMSDLAESSVYTPSLDSGPSNFDLSKHRSLTHQQPKHSTPIAYTKANSSTKHQHSSRHLKKDHQAEEFLNSISLPQTAKLKKSLEDLAISSGTYLCTESVSPSSSESSLDTMSLLAGRSKPNIPLTSSHLEFEELEGERSWERVTTFKPPVHIKSSETDDKPHLTNGHLSQQNFEGTFSGRKQPGSMETLKNMLFKLQAEETSTQNKQNKVEESCEGKAEGNELADLQDYDFSQEPGGHSLEQALIHLNRLKELVKNTQVATGSALKI